MGCSSSSLPPIETEQESLLKKSFHYSEDDISLLYEAFKKIDLTQSNAVEFDEFCVRCKCEPSLFLESIFSFFSSTEAKNPSLSFVEFAFFISFFLTLDETGLAQFLYKVLTTSHFNRISTRKELRKVSVIEESIVELFGKAWGNREKLHKILHTMDQDHSGSISEAEFVKNCLKNKSLLFATVRYQLDLRGRVLSHPFWAKREGAANKLLPDVVRTRNSLNRLSSASSTPTEVNSLSSAMAHSVQDAETHSKGHHKIDV